MKEIVNKTMRPVRIPLPGGKFLALGPAKSGQVSDQATQLPSFKRLLDEGTIELLGDGGRSVGAPEGASTQPSATQGHKQQTVTHTKGNR